MKNRTKLMHVLNGDSTLTGFQESGIPGNAIVWREVFSEGPLIENILSVDFWRVRSEWIEQTFGESRENYDKKAKSILEVLKERYDELTLWFEFDLHCQINLLGVMMILKKSGRHMGQTVNLICPDRYPGIDDFRGMGQLRGDQLAILYPERVALTSDDFELAEHAWKLRLAGNPELINQFLIQKKSWGNMFLLKPALEAYANRLQVNFRGLGHIEQILLDIYNSGLKQKSQIYQAFWQSEKIYGMGDTEIDIYLKSLVEKKLINI